MVIVLASAARLLALLVTTGRVVATCTAAPLLMPLVVTMALRLPAAGAVDRLMVNKVDVAEATVPAAPESNTTLLLAAVESKPKPTISTCVALELNCDPALAVTTGDTPAIATDVPLLIELVLTEALSTPAADGLVPNVTVNEVEDAVVTVPVAPLSKVTTLLAAVGSKP